jgi:peptidyl-prolyl cis-trans isomerase SurA
MKLGALRAHPLISDDRSMRILSAAVLSFLVALPLAAQEPSAAVQGETELLDRVVAVVGDTALLLSDVHEGLERLRASGQELPTDPAGQAELFRQVLGTQVDNLVVLQAARRANVEVPAREVESVVDQELAQIRTRFGSEAAFAAAIAESGLTAAEFRRIRIEQATAEATIRRFLQQQVQSAIPPIVDDAELRQVFESRRAELGERPATVSFEQVVIQPLPTDSARAAARARAEEVLAELRAGGDFEVLARRFSDDPGSRERGGDLGWFRQGQMVRPFEQMAFALRPGDISPIVETDFGFHIIKIEKVRSGERQGRHILIKAAVTEQGQSRARADAVAAASAARSGTAFADLQTRYSTPVDQRLGEDVQLDRLPPAYAVALEGVQAGTVVGPFEIVGAADGSEWVVLRLQERRAAGPYTLEDVRDRVRELIQEQKVMKQVVEDLRRTTYVNILV